MTLLLDTHRSSRGSKERRRWVGEREPRSPTLTTRCSSASSAAWELAIELSLGKLRLTQSLERFIPNSWRNGFVLFTDPA